MHFRNVNDTPEGQAALAEVESVIKALPADVQQVARWYEYSIQSRRWANRHQLAGLCGCWWRTIQIDVDPLGGVEYQRFIIAHEIGHAWLHHIGEPQSEDGADALAELWGYPRPPEPEFHIIPIEDAPNDLWG